jgi:hypothetical protein
VIRRLRAIVKSVDFTVWPHMDGETPRDRKGFGRRWARDIWLLLRDVLRQFDLDGPARCAWGSCASPAYPSRYCGVHDAGLIAACARWVDYREAWA